MEPRLIETPAALREFCDARRATAQRVGLVPTMGALHRGHLSLIDAARGAGADTIVVSIFVNPLQFAQNEDLERYPRTLESDLRHCAQLGVDAVYLPGQDAMYGPHFQSHVEVERVTRPLEGAQRPTHFRGVTTVVAKLFNATGPCVATFGRKDYQQWRAIAQMVDDLDMPVEVLGCPIVREDDGLALSSRNRYLNTEQRGRALGLVRGLAAAQTLFSAGERGAEALLAAARAPVDEHFDRVDYVSIANPQTLEPVSGRLQGDAALLAAAHLGSTRLIDNTVLGREVLQWAHG